MDRKDRSEIALVILFIAVAAVFVVETFTFRSDAATLFPRLTAAVVIVGGVLLLAERYLPDPIQRVVAEPVDLVDREEFETDDTDVAEGEDDRLAEPINRDGGRRRLTERQFLFVSVAAYVAASYAISILLATPLFVAAYGYWNDQRPLYVGILAVLAVAICMLFVSLANAPLDRGLLFPRGIL